MGEMDVTGNITRAALSKECGPNLAASVLRAIPSAKEILIPHFEHLKKGDIILSRRLEKDGSPETSLIEIGQRAVARKNFSDEECHWCHSMVYVGRMHVAESQGTYRQNGQKKQGLRVAPLTEYGNHDLLICRHKDIEVAGNNTSHYAILTCVVDPRKYPFQRLYASAIQQFLGTKLKDFGILEMLVKKMSQRDLQKAITCSEFALECLAIGGTCMVEHYNNVNDGRDEFYPADFCKSGEFQRLPMTYMRVKD